MSIYHLQPCLFTLYPDGTNHHTGLTSYFYTNYVGNPMVIATVMGTGGLVGLAINTVITPFLNKRFQKEVLHVIAIIGLIISLIILYGCLLGEQGR